MTQPAKPMQLTDIITQVVDRVGRFGVDIDDLPMPLIYSWWHPVYGKYQDFRLQTPHPWDDELVVVSLFRDEDEVRVYTARIKEQAQGAPPEQPLKRFVLSKRNQSYEVEQFTIESFVLAIANEWMMVATDMTTADAERATIVEHLRKKGWGIAADSIAAEEHLEEEPEPEPAPTPNGPAGGSTTPSPLS